MDIIGFTNKGNENPRITQQKLYPTAIKARNLDHFIFGSGVDTASTVLANTEQAVLTSTLNQTTGAELQGIFYIAIYIGSVADANLLPGGSGIDESQWQVIGPRYSYENWSAVSFSQSKDIASIYVRNISAGSQTVIFKTKWRYISPNANG